MIRAAGIMFLNDEGEVLLLKRGPGSDYPGSWCFPGGRLEEGESLEDCAERETIEELGSLPKGDRTILTRSISAGSLESAPVGSPPVGAVPHSGESVDYTTFLQRVQGRFEPKLNGEHTGFMWVHTKALGEMFGGLPQDGIIQ